ncbi:MAG TPA: lipoyl(octanoyl) transferase LipB [Synechococcales cyanobacterium M55_K2018_004]|nr:lipoyl(octanoyl) transferase LipB [Synechococcales cyanobacterium M55_K2018_004]
MSFSSLPHNYCVTFSLGLIPYRISLELQRSLLQLRRHQPNQEDMLLLVEHPPVYTLGQGATLDFLKFDPTTSEFELHRIERGGEVTYHCPGQLVVYPILDLRRYRTDLHWYLRQLEEVVIRVVESYGLKGDRIPNLTGVWIEDRKVAAIGIKVSRWITMHGFALNVCPDLRGFQQIVPCGIADKPVGSLAEFIPDLTIEDVQPKVLKAFAEVFQVTLQTGDPKALLSLMPQ